MLGGSSRRVFLGGAVSAVASVAFAEAPAVSLRPEARPEDLGGAAPLRAGLAAPSTADLIKQARLGGQVSFVVADAHTGVVLENHAGDTPLPPASVAKTATTLYALSTLGEDFRFRTELVATGPVAGGVIQGDLVLTGNGDPLLDTNALEDMVRALKAKGVRGVSGKFMVFGGALPYVRKIDPDQPDHVGYNPSVGGVNLNFNRVHFEWKKATQGWTVSMDARSNKVRPAVTTATMQVVKRELPVYTYRDVRDVDKWTVASGALGKGGSRWLPVRHPDLYAGDVVKVLAAAQGIKLPPAQAVKAMPGGTVLAQHQSPTLSTVVRLMLKYSTNLSAEVLGLSASLRRGVAAKSLKASAQAMNDWLHSGFGMARIRLVDHSGLGGHSRVTAEDLVRMLVKVGPGGLLQAHMKEITPVDRQGKALAHPGYTIQAKTGTLNFVSALAGYVTSDRGKVLAFAILTGDVARRDRIAREDMERPEGGRAWLGRSRAMQRQLLRRWAGLYG